MMEIPPELKTWVAENGQGPTKVVNPCYIDYRAREQLLFYHPGFDKKDPHELKHVAARDVRSAYARVDVSSLSNNWNEKMAEVTLALKLRPKQEGNLVFLIDEEIKDMSPPILMQGWQVVKWIVSKATDMDGTELHQELITWKKGELVVPSVYSWRPYAAPPPPKYQIAKDLMTNGLSIHVHLHNY